MKFRFNVLKHKCSIMALVLFTISCVGTAFASDIFLAQSAAGAGDGSSCANARAISWFNATSSWGAAPGLIGPGTNIHLCGNFNDSTPGDTLLTFQGSGTSGNPITLTFESGAILTNSAYWGANGAIYIHNKNYIVVDGGANGIVQNTGDGTGLSYNHQSNGIAISGGGTGITIENLMIKNICQRSAGDTGDSCSAGGGGTDSAAISISRSGSGSWSNITIQHNTIANGGHTCIWLNGSSSDSAVTILKNSLSGCNWGIASDDGANITINGNDITCVPGARCNWDDPSDANHHNGIFFFPQTANMPGVVISNNYIHDIGGTTNPGGGGAGTETGHIYFETKSGADIPGALIYNNLLTTSAGAYSPANAYIADREGATNTDIFNNTIVESTSSASHEGSCIMGQMSPTIENNICVGMEVGIWLSNGATGVVSNYNDFYNLISNGRGTFITQDGSTSYPTLARWTAATGYDGNSVSGNPDLTSFFLLNPGSAAIGKGTDLSTASVTGLSTGAPQTFGANYACGSGCTARTSRWDIGAYEFSGLLAPTNLTGTVAPQ